MPEIRLERKCRTCGDSISKILKERTCLPCQWEPMVSSPPAPLYFCNRCGAGGARG